MNRWVLCGLLLGVVLNSHAKVYKWTDEQGNIHYSDQPKNLRTDQSEEYSVKDAYKGDAYSQQRLESVKQTLEKKREQRTEQNEQRGMLAKQREQDKKQCEFWQQKKQRLSQQAPMYKTDEDGNRHYYDDKERSALLQEAAGNIQKYCR